MSGKAKKATGSLVKSALAGSLFVALAAACGGGAASVEGGEGAKTPEQKTTSVPCSADACLDLGSCPLTSKEHADAFNCRACDAAATKGCSDAKSCPVRDATTLEAMVCRAIDTKMSCAEALSSAVSAWQKDGEPPFVDDATLRSSVRERYARLAPSLVCPSATASLR